MQTVVETPTFTHHASKLFTDDEKVELINLLATDPLAGDVMPGTGGVRKLRFRATGSGKLREVRQDRPHPGRAASGSCPRRRDQS